MALINNPGSGGNTNFTDGSIPYASGGILVENNNKIRWDNTNSTLYVNGIPWTTSGISSLYSIFTPSGTGAVSRPVSTKLAELPTVGDFTLRANYDTYVATLQSAPPLSGKIVEVIGTSANEVATNESAYLNLNVKGFKRSFGAVGDNTADDSTKLANALATGKTIEVEEGTYKLISLMTMNTQYQRLVGQSRKAILNFVPVGALTDAISMQGFDMGVENLSITVNANVTNAIHVVGNGSRGRVKNILFTGTKTAGQIAAFVDATVLATYFYRWNDLDIDNFDLGMKLDNGANAQYIDQINFSRFNTGIHCNTQLCMISNIFGQTQANAVLRFAASGQNNTAVNINGESNTAPTVLLDSGAKLNKITGVVNTGSGGAVTDNSAGGGTRPNFIESGDTGQITVGVPAVVSASQAYNTFGTKVMVVVQVGTTPTNVNKNAVYMTTLTSSGVSVILNADEFINVSQTTNVTWTWWKI